MTKEDLLEAGINEKGTCNCSESLNDSYVGFDERGDSNLPQDRQSLNGRVDRCVFGIRKLPVSLFVGQAVCLLGRLKLSQVTTSIVDYLFSW